MMMMMSQKCPPPEKQHRRRASGDEDTWIYILKNSSSSFLCHLGVLLTRKNLFKLTLRRADICQDFDDEYYCTYKFDVHVGDHTHVNHNPIDRTRRLVSLYSKHVPSDHNGIMLIVVLHWEVTHPSKHDSTIHLETYHRPFFIPEQGMESAANDNLSRILHALGMLSTDDNRSATRRLLDSVLSVYRNAAPSQWTPVFVKIVIQRFTLTHQLDFIEDYYLWGIRDSKRFAAGLELMTQTETSQLEADEESCPICLKVFQADCEVARMPTCTHFYHPNCIMEWLEKQSFSCPSCRATVSDFKWRRSHSFLFLRDDSVTS